MLEQLPALILWLSVFQFNAVAQDKKCSISPPFLAAIVNETRELMCLGDSGTLILSWKLGNEPAEGSFNFSGIGIYKTYDPLNLPAYSSNISVLGVSGTAEFSRQLQTDGYETTYYSLRQVTVKITSVKEGLARPFYCFVFDIAAKKILYCESKLNVIVKGPSFGSTRIDLSKGIVTNVTCAITFQGGAIVHMKITDKQRETLNVIGINFTSYGVHTYELNFHKEINIVSDADGSHRVSPGQGIQSAFRCVITFGDEAFWRKTMKCEVDAPVTYTSIVPYNDTRCTQRRCYMHEKLICESDGRPKPKEFQWRLASKYAKFVPMLDKTPYQYTLISGRNTFECKAFNSMGDYKFAATGRLTLHVEAFEWKLDEYATHEAKGNKREVWYPVTILATVTGIMLIYLPCCRY